MLSIQRGNDDFFFQAHGRSATGGLAKRHRGHRDAGGSMGAACGAVTAAGDEQVLDLLRHE